MRARAHGASAVWLVVGVVGVVGVAVAGGACGPTATGPATLDNTDSTASGDAPARDGDRPAGVQRATLEGPFASISAYCDRAAAARGRPPASHVACSLLDPGIFPPTPEVGGIIDTQIVMVIDDVERDASTCRIAVQTADGWYIEAPRAGQMICTEPGRREPADGTSDMFEDSAIVSKRLVVKAYGRDEAGLVDGEQSMLWLCHADETGPPRCTTGITTACDWVACDGESPDAWSSDVWVEDGELVVAPATSEPDGAADRVSPRRISPGRHRLPI